MTRSWHTLQPEIDDLDAQLTPLVTAIAPRLVALPGVGVDTAGQLLVTAGDKPGRLRSERSFARLCGVAPVPVSSGRSLTPDDRVTYHLELASEIIDVALIGAVYRPALTACRSMRSTSRSLSGPAAPA